jgi:hypothetical protein
MENGDVELVNGDGAGLDLEFHEVAGFDSEGVEDGAGKGDAVAVVDGAAANRWVGHEAPTRP